MIEGIYESLVWFLWLQKGMGLLFWDPFIVGKLYLAGISSERQWRDVFFLLFTRGTSLHVLLLSA